MEFGFEGLGPGIHGVGFELGSRVGVECSPRDHAPPLRFCLAGYFDLGLSVLGLRISGI